MIGDINSSSSRFQKLGLFVVVLFLLSVAVDICSDRIVTFIGSSEVEHSQLKDPRSKDPGSSELRNDSDKSNQTATQNDNSICSLEGFGDSSARYLWVQYLHQIHEASRLEDDTDYLRHDFTVQLLALMTPRLDHSIKTLTKDWQLVTRLLNKAYERYQYLVQTSQSNQRNDLSNTNKKMDKVRNEDEKPLPIRITVLGGSLAVGIQCRTGIPGHEYNDNSTRYCAWPNRLESFVNQLFGVGQLVEVRNEAVGGTSTDTGRVILKYDLIEGILETSDILIHAYSTNDTPHVSTKQFDRYFNSLQEFCRYVLQPPRARSLCRSRNRDNPTSIHRHHHPLFIHVNDAIGHLRAPLAKYTRMPQVVSSLANYYGFVSLSYVDMVRDIVFGDPKETWFSANEFRGGEMYQPDPHPGQGMHIVTTWMIAYVLLEIATTYCTLHRQFWKTSLFTTKDETHHYADTEEDVERLEEAIHQRNTLSYTYVADFDNTILSESIPLFMNGTDKQSEGMKPHLPPPIGLLPSVDKDMTMSELNARWKTDSKQMQRAQNRPCPRNEEDSIDNKCPLAWVSGHDQSKDMAWIEEHVMSRLTETNSWKVDLHRNFRKMGLTPPEGEVGAEMSLEFDLRSINGSNSRPISTVLIFYLKSYGTTWKDSRAHVEIFIASNDDDEVDDDDNYDEDRWKLLADAELVGFHSRKTSEMYSVELELGGDKEEGDTGDNFGVGTNAGVLRVQTTLVDGVTFKVMGLALCH